MEKLENQQFVRISIPKQEDVEFKVICHPEHIPIQGNAVCSGNDVEDKEIEDQIMNDLNNGNMWAWCMMEVVATWKDLSYSDYLGGCSFKSEKDFLEDIYYDNMKLEAYLGLVSKIKKMGA